MLKESSKSKFCIFVIACLNTHYSQVKILENRKLFIVPINCERTEFFVSQNEDNRFFLSKGAQFQSHIRLGFLSENLHLELMFSRTFLSVKTLIRICQNIVITTLTFQDMDAVSTIHQRREQRKTPEYKSEMPSSKIQIAESNETITRFQDNSFNY